MIPLDTALRRLFPFVVGAELALAAYLQAAGLSCLISALVVEGSPPPVPVPRTRAAAEPDREHETSADAILARNPFDSATGPLDGLSATTVTENAASVAPPVDADCEAGKVVLIASSSDPAWSFVAIASGGASVLRRVGDAVEGGAVAQIGWDRVWLIRDTGRCQLRLGVDDPAAQRGRKAIPPPARPGGKGGSRVPADLAAKIQKISEREFVVDRTAVDTILETQADLMKSVRLVPEKNDGRVVGLRVSRVSPGSLLGLLGLQNGDRLQSINGFSLTDPQKALEAYARLRTASSLSLAIHRAGKDTTIDFRIR